ncbi:hypothetical protein ACFWGD_00570 [Corynebacterium sp. NPDC060344]|uniref:hypothetical protein n=1 Tax=Corynebacterium sp. NPDC060344 TaxID=3347101 RepID=UPI00365B17BC
MSRPDHAGYDPFDANTGAGGASQPGDGQAAPGYGAPAYGTPDQSGPGYGGGAGYDGYYADPARHGYGAGGAQPSVPTGKGMAIAALILGLLAIPTAFVIFGGLLAIIAIILAVVALRAGSKARKLGSTQTGGTTAMSVIAIVSSILALIIFGFIIWGVVIGAGAAAECQHLIQDRTAYDTCIQNSVFGSLGIN